MLRVEFANQIAANGVGLAEQGVFSVYRSAITVYSCLLVFRFKDDTPRTPPLLRVERSNLRRYGISSQVADADFHKAVLIRAAYAIFSTSGCNAGYVIFRFIFQAVAAQTDTHFTSSVQGNTRIVQLISESHISAIGTYGIVQPDIIVQHSARYDQLQTGFLKIIGLVPFESILFAMFHGTDAGVLSLYGKTDFRGVA